MAQASQRIVAPEWVSIGRACQMLGVNPATLRQWTNHGKIHVYRTPGGHRRFRTAEITLLSQVADPTPRETAVGTIVQQIRAKYRGLAQSSTAHQGWIGSIDDAPRQRFHQLGDELLDRLGEYLSASSPSQKHRALARAEEIARQYGQLAGGLGIDTAQAVEAYLLFRRPLLDVLARSLSGHPEMVGQLGRIMRDAERFMDGVLAGVTGASGQPQSGPGKATGQRQPL